MSQGGIIFMLMETEYNRKSAADYAIKWAFARNPRFYDFEDMGGDCTNFVSQCLYAGCGTMNFSETDGWYYLNGNDKSPSWTGVIFLKKFLLTNEGAGVYGITAELSELKHGDIVQLKNYEGILYHSLFVSYVIQPAKPSNIFVCAHLEDARNRRLTDYSYAEAEGIHILGARKEI